MTAGGWVAMAVSVAAVLALNAWCLWRIFKTRQ